MTNPRKTGYCAVCEYIKKHKKCGLNTKLMEGASYRSIAIETGLDQRTIAKHAKAGHGMRPVIAQAGRTKAVKEGLELVKCQKKVWDDAQEAVDYALGRKKPPQNPLNLGVFGQCIAPQVKIIEVLAKVSDIKDDDVPGIDRAIAKMKESRDGQ
ncbi:hypothetical protein M0R72_18990 [Candidatus Pacearchaeota archaeon]|jgi:hypothetical protein|nr:hypothetical protein [Candidatus Pacearchaeota archaeon]